MFRFAPLLLAVIASACVATADADPGDVYAAEVIVYNVTGTTLSAYQASATKMVDKAGVDVTGWGEFSAEPQIGDDVSFTLDDGRDYRGIVFARSIDSGDVVLRVASTSRRW